MPGLIEIEKKTNLFYANLKLTQTCAAGITGTHRRAGNIAQGYYNIWALKTLFDQGDQNEVL
jgi:hypothetical protein